MYYDWTVTIDGYDVSEFVYAGGTIVHGRQTDNTGFQVPRAVFRMPAGFDPIPLPPPTMSGDPFWGVGLFIGANVEISVTWDGYIQYRRFTGKVWAIDWTKDEIQVTALGYSMQLDGMKSGYIPDGLIVPAWPVELDLTRAERIVGQGEPGYGYLNITTVGTQGRYVIARPTNSPAENMLDLLIQLEVSADGLLFEDGFGDLYYRSRIWPKPDRYALPSGLVDLQALDMAYEGGNAVNTVQVFYGDDGTLSETAEDAASIAAIGTRSEEVTTILQFRVGARGKANTYLLEHALSWTAPDVTIIMGLASGTQADDILALGEGYAVRVNDLPDNNPLGYLDADIIGLTEIMHPEDFRLVLHLANGISTDPGLDPDPDLTAYDGQWLYDSDEILYGS